MKNNIIEKLKSENKLLKNQVKQLEQRNENKINYEIILNSLKEGLYICDINNNIIFANDILKKKYGNINNKKCFEYFYGNKEKCPDCNFNRILKGETIRSEWLSPIDKKSYEVIESPLVNTDGSIFKIKILRDISGRKKKNERIKDIAKFPLENPNPVIRITKDGKILYSNEAGISLLKKWSYNVGMKVKNREIKFLKEIYTSKKNKSVEIKYNEKYFSLTLVPVMDKDYINIYGFEITERKLLELENERKHNIIEQISFEVKKQAMELETIFSSITEPIIIYSKNGKVKKINNAAKKSLHFNPINMVQEDIIKKLNSKTEKGEKCNKKNLPSTRALKGETINNEKYYFIDPLKEEKIVEVSASPIKIEKEIEGAVLIWHDITERVNEEKKLKQSHKNLKEEAELKDHEIIIQSEIINKIFSNTHIAIAYLDVDFNFIKVNNAYARADDKTTDFFVGKNHFDLFPNEENKKIFKEVLKTGKSYFTFAKPFKYENNPERGITYWDWSLIPIKDKKNRVEGLILSLLDVSERILNKIKLDKTENELGHARRLSDIGKLAATVAHELRNPLAVIEAASYNIEKKCRNNNIDIHINNINKKINEAEKIISDLLTYAKINNPNFQKIKIIDLLNESILNVKNIYPDYKVRIIKKYHLNDFNIMADPFQIKKVFNNILINAFQSLKNNKGNIAIDLSYKDDNLLTVIEDNGTGIDKNDLDKLFDPFFTKKTRGTGLGLSICKEIINLHNGKINITSSIDIGTKVEITLPKRKK